MGSLHQWVIHPWLGPYRQQPAAPCLGVTDLVVTPLRGAESRADHADHHVGPAQPLVDPLLPVLAHLNAIAQILVQEHFVTLSNQPPLNLLGGALIFAGMADEYLSTAPPRRPAGHWRQAGSTATHPIRWLFGGTKPYRAGARQMACDHVPSRSTRSQARRWSTSGGSPWRRF